MTAHKLHVMIVTGMSGAGRSTALHVLEDLGFFCIDNLPPAFVPKLLDELSSSGELKRIALGIDVRTGTFLGKTHQAMQTLIESGHNVEIFFLDCADATLVRRFSETRRPHPLAPLGDVLDAIQTERERLSELRAMARIVIDTTRLSVHDLRRQLIDIISQGIAKRRMVTRIVSFGFKFGLPVDADWVIDLRYLPNPYFESHLKDKTGLDKDVSDFVLQTIDAEDLISDLSSLFGKLLPQYEKEGKAYLTIALGCTGGKHRSVAFAEHLGRTLHNDHKISVSHRDIDRSTA